MKIFFATMLVSGLMFTGCGLLGDDDDAEPSSTLKASATSSKDGVVYNVTGPDQGAYDLLKGEGVSLTSPNASKDLADGEAEDFTTKFFTANGAYFIEDIEGLTYSTSAGEVADFSVEFEDVASDETAALEVGDVVIVLLNEDRGATAELALIEITAVTEDSDADTNDGSIEFKYKLIDID